jgi:excisionase family DNA binding protein
MAELSVPEVAKTLGVSETIVRRLVRRGELAVAREERIGQQTRRYFDADVVEALRKRRAREST